MFEIIYNKK